ncbi:YrdB family protein [Actinoallomurus sp. NPDC050550]|uniref:YrdB family protein n=1 Tax=Actinoallomurus sp. NPDC050550 TaxID=3154937 RepID=UPI0033C37DBC
MIPRPLHLANEALAFLLELMALAVLAWWGVRAGDGVLLKAVLGIGAPAAAAVIWGMFAAPKARVRLPLPGVLLVKALVFGVAALALYGLDHSGLALGFAVIAIANTAIATLDRNALIRNRPRP